MSWHGEQEAGFYTPVKAATTAEQPFLVPRFKAVSTLELCSLQQVAADTVHVRVQLMFSPTQPSAVQLFR